MDQLYQIQLRAPLHVGSNGIGKEGSLAYIPSDTLFAAMVATWAWLSPVRLNTMLASFQAGKPPFLLSSAFPYAGAVRFYPVPALDAPLSAAIQTDLGKKLKRLFYVSEQILLRWLQGHNLADQIEERAKSGDEKISNFIHGGHIWVTSDERKAIAQALDKSPAEPHKLRIWSEDVAPHVAVGRSNNSPNLFHTGRVNFVQGSGLWFDVRYLDQSYKDDIKVVLNLMADSGIGGLRSIGHGAFNWEPWNSPALFSAPKPAAYGLLLNRLAPKADQMNALSAEKAIYRLTTIGGWCGNEGEQPRKRRRVRLVTEGSVVRWPDTALGQLVDVNPKSDGLDHGVYRFGYGLGVAVHEKALEATYE